MDRCRGAEEGARGGDGATSLPVACPPCPPCQKGGLGPEPWGRAEERGEGLQAPGKPGPSSGKATAIGASRPTLMLRVTFCSWL